MKFPRTALHGAVFAFGLSVSGIAEPHVASADDGIGAIQITCAPEVGYFSIRRFALPPYATNEQFQSLLPRLASAHVETARQLKAVPAECDLLVTMAGQPDQKRTVRVRAEGFFDGDSEPGPRRITNHVQVSVGGNVVGLLGLNLYTFAENTTDLIEVFTNGVAVFSRKCAYYAPPELQPKQGCTSEQL